MAVGLGLEVLQREVLELRLDRVQAEPVRERREEVAGFGRDADLFLGRQPAERPHVVEAVGELDQDHAHVRRHREHQLADVLGVPERAALEDGADLGHAIRDRSDVVAELRADKVQREGRVLDGVVQQGRGDGHVVGADVAGGDQRHLERVRDVHLA